MDGSHAPGPLSLCPFPLSRLCAHLSPSSVLCCAQQKLEQLAGSLLSEIRLLSAPMEDLNFAHFLTSLSQVTPFPLSPLTHYSRTTADHPGDGAGRAENGSRLGRRAGA
jgi:hypothetical protein